MGERLESSVPLNVFYRTDKGEFKEIGTAFGEPIEISIESENVDSSTIRGLRSSFAVDFEAETTVINIPYLKYLCGLQTNNWKKAHGYPMRRRKAIKHKVAESYIFPSS